MIDRYTVVLNLPKDLGDCLICTPAINALVKHCERKNYNLVAVGGKFQLNTIKTLTGIELNHQDISAVEGRNPRFAINMNFHEDDLMKKLAPETKVYAPEKMAVVPYDNQVFGEGAILGKKHIAKALEDCLKEAGVIGKSRTLGAPVLDEKVTSEEARKAAMEDLGIIEPYAAMVPVCAANRPWKRWQPEKFAEMAKWIASGGVTPILFGGPTDDERKLTVEINNMSGGVCKTVHASLDKVAALMSGAEFTLSNDTGLFHIAAAAGKPTFGLFGYYNDHNTWAPKQKNSHIINGDKIQNLEVMDVYNKIKTAIATNSKQRVFNSVAARKVKNSVAKQINLYKKNLKKLGIS